MNEQAIIKKTNVIIYSPYVVSTCMTLFSERLFNIIYILLEYYKYYKLKFVKYLHIYIFTLLLVILVLKLLSVSCQGNISN